MCALLLFVLLLGCPGTGSPPVDEDGDGVPVPRDCDDGRPGVFPGAPELCDGIDNDCDGAVDEGWDEDGDGARACGMAPDCDDADASVYPGAPEACDGLDNDCDGAVDEDGAEDADADGYCAGLDCDDGDPAVHPAATEVCDGVDQDCDGVVDQGIDADADGVDGCGGPDCDDAAAGVYPGAAESCDGVDQDCDGLVDEDFDADGDGVTTCAAPPDCDDADPAVAPGAPEVCDGIDNDCDGSVDEDTGADLDGDGLDPCEGDCDDGDAAVHPGALELPGGVDDDCDGIVDEPYAGAQPVGGFAPTVSGTEPLQELGLTMSRAGDFNGDGLSDFASGNGGFAQGRGLVHLILGVAYDVGHPPPTISPQFGVEGSTEGLFLGASVDLGDINGDGLDDLIVGQPMNNSVALPTGAVFVWFGEATPPAGDRSPLSADLILYGDQPTEHCGTAVAALGDVNGDGIGDLGMTCPWYSEVPGPFQGRLLIFFGRTSWDATMDAGDADASVVGSPDDGGIGQSLLGDLDVDGDGWSDVLLGSSGWSGDSGRSALFLGGPSRWSRGRSIDSADALYSGSSGGSSGAALAGGDADGDGLADLLIGSPNDAAEAGSLALIDGSSSPTGGGLLASSRLRVLGAAAFSSAGTAAALLDLDGDGSQDLVVGAPATGAQAHGEVAVWYGPLASLGGELFTASADLRFTGSSPGGFLGGALVALPDFNGDGAPDLAISAPYDGVQSTGTVYIVPGFP